MLEGFYERDIKKQNWLYVGNIINLIRSPHYIIDINTPHLDNAAKSSYGLQLTQMDFLLIEKYIFGADYVTITPHKKNPQK